MQLEPYLHFDGVCEEALNYYKEVFAGEMTIAMRYAQAPPEFAGPAEYGDKIMHANFKASALEFMASDVQGASTARAGSRVSLSLSTTDATEGRRVFDELAQGGKVAMPFQDAFWGGLFGMLRDRFGIDWMVSSDKES